MENDSIRASGTNTLVDVWIEGKLRAICVTREAIESFLGCDASNAPSEEGRCEFVRTHLGHIAAAAKKSLRGNTTAPTITIAAGQLETGGGRRIGDRRQAERRKISRPVQDLPHGERRQVERRSSSRRRKPN